MKRDFAKGTKWWMALALVVVLLIAGCSSNGGSTTQPSPSNSPSASQPSQDPGNAGGPKRGGELKVGVHVDISSFDPIKGTAAADYTPLMPIYDTLIGYNPDLEPVPGLAEKWEIQDDTTLVLYLRQGVTFHDGTPFDAEAVKFNLERGYSEESVIADLKTIDSVEVVDTYTVKVKLKAPDPSILMSLSDRGGMMLSPTAVKEKGEDYVKSPVGTGPFKFVSYTSGSEIVYEANENYWQEGKPYLDRLVFKVLPDENARVNAINSGQVDMVTYISPINIAALERNANLTVVESNAIPQLNFFINTSVAPFDNKKLRQVLLYGINRQALIQALNFGKGFVANQPFPNEYWAADPDLVLDYNPEKAKQLLAESGLQDKTITITHPSTADFVKMAEAIKGQLKEIGLEVKLEAMEPVSMGQNFLFSGEIPIILYSWTGRPDPLITVKSLYSKDGLFNPGKYTTPELESLLDAAMTTYDQEERAKLFRQMNRVAVEQEALYVPVYSNPAVVSMKNNFKGYTPNLLGRAFVHEMWAE